MDAQEPHVNMDAEATEVLPRLDGSWRRDGYSWPGSSWRADIIDTLCVMAALVVLMFMLANQAGGLRTFAAFCFAFFVPGRAIVTNWARLAEWSDIGMSVVLSLALVTSVSLLTLWLKYWHPIGLFQVEAALSVAGLGTAIGRRNGMVIPFPGKR
jgi:uncharacterized membrane protein